jgi:hypothetical protein
MDALILSCYLELFEDKIFVKESTSSRGEDDSTQYSHKKIFSRNALKIAGKIYVYALAIVKLIDLDACPWRYFGINDWR